MFISPGRLLLRARALKVENPDALLVTPAMQSALRTAKHAEAKRALDAKKFGMGKGKLRNCKRAVLKAVRKKRATRDTPSSSAKHVDAVGEEADDHQGCDDWEWGDGDDWRGWAWDEEAGWQPENKDAPEPKSKKAKTVPKATAKAKAKWKAKARPKAKAKASPKAKAKASPKAKAKGVAKVKAAEAATPSKAKLAKAPCEEEAVDEDEWTHGKPRKVWLGHRWLFEILEEQTRGCSNCRFIFWGCTACRKTSFRGKSAEHTRGDPEYQAALANLSNEAAEEADDEGGRWQMVAEGGAQGQAQVQVMLYYCQLLRSSARPLFAHEITRSLSLQS